ncbi:MAG: polyprenyl synthetase family protein [Chthoniobacterales bacterium]
MSQAISNDDLQHYIAACCRKVDTALKRLLPPATTRPAILHEAMRYSLFVGGKRLRPVLTLTACEACGGKQEQALHAACAVELVHTYSLVHDDLPCMDDDDLRRGRPTSHKVYGEGIAVLTGDALLTQAFEILGKYQPDSVADLALAAGSRALIAGQIADLQAEGKKIDRRQLRFIHEGKTSAMIAVSLKLGAQAAKAPAKKIAVLESFGKQLGLAFQVIDDILDCTQTSEQLGKSAGKDIAAQKSTYPALLGLEGAKKEAQRLTQAAIRKLESFGSKKQTATLHALARYLLQREF